MVVQQQFKWTAVWYHLGQAIGLVYTWIWSDLEVCPSCRFPTDCLSSKDSRQNTWCTSWSILQWNSISIFTSHTHTSLFPIFVNHPGNCSGTKTRTALYLSYVNESFSSCISQYRQALPQAYLAPQTLPRSIFRPTYSSMTLKFQTGCHHWNVKYKYKRYCRW